MRPLWLLLPIAVALSGCAYRYTDANGTDHIIGFVKMKIDPRPEDETLAGHVISVKLTGLGVVHTPQRSFFALGYSHDKIAYIRNHVLVCGDPLQAIDDPEAAAQITCPIDDWGLE